VITCRAAELAARWARVRPAVPTAAARVTSVRPRLGCPTAPRARPVKSGGASRRPSLAASCGVLRRPAADVRTSARRRPRRAQLPSGQSADRGRGQPFGTGGPADRGGPEGEIRERVEVATEPGGADALREPAVEPVAAPGRYEQEQEPQAVRGRRGSERRQRPAPQCQGVRCGEARPRVAFNPPRPCRGATPALPLGSRPRSGGRCGRGVPAPDETALRAG